MEMQLKKWMAGTTMVLLAGSSAMAWENPLPRLVAPSIAPAIAPAEAHAQKPSPMGEEEKPDWLVKMIKGYETSGRGPQNICSYKYQEKRVYFVPSSGGDQFSTVYDSDGNVLGHPTGGFTGRGDGKMGDFLKTATERTVVWEKPRDVDAQWKHWLSRTKRIEQSMGAGAALKMWKFHLQRGKLTGDKKKAAQAQIKRLEKIVKENPDAGKIRLPKKQ